MSSRKNTLVLGSTPSRYTVVKDTREQKGWQFLASESCAGTLVQTLDTGDYSLLGYEHLLRVERKGSVVEFVQNITQKDRWRNFREELERLEVYQAPYLVLEFTADDLVVYPQTSGLPWRVRSKVKVKPAFLLKRFHEIELHFRTKIKFVGPTFGKEWMSSLFKRIVERWPQPPPPVSRRRPGN